MKTRQPKPTQTSIGPCTYRQVRSDTWAVYGPDHRPIGEVYRLGNTYEASNTNRPYGNLGEAITGMATRLHLDRPAANYEALAMAVGLAAVGAAMERA
jgi:hypothetical protein